MNNKNKHLTLDNRLEIQCGLQAGESFRTIALKLNKSTTTISNEIKRHLKTHKASPYGRVHNSCTHRQSCELYEICSPCRYKKPRLYCHMCNYCNSNCPSYEEEICEKLSRAPYVCNPCPDRNKCSLNQKVYNAKEANESYTSSWREDREGFYLTGNEMDRVCELMSERIKKGQSPYAILAHIKDQIPCSISTVYRLIDDSQIEARNGHLPLKMRRRPNNKGKKKKAHKVDPKCTSGRTYEDFLGYIKEHSPPFVVEMDTVEGKKGSSVLLTLGWKSFSVLRAHKRAHNDARSVKEVFDEYEQILGLKLFRKLFPLLLTDRGTEFSDPQSIEFSPFTGERRTYLFYCDPQRADQKGSIENNHKELRRIIPKGTDFDKYTQEEIQDATDHINSYPREKLSDKSAYETFKFFLGDGPMVKLGWREIRKEEVVLVPRKNKQINK